MAEAGGQAIWRSGAFAARVEGEEGEKKNKILHRLVDQCQDGQVKCVAVVGVHLGFAARLGNRERQKAPS